MKRSPPVAVEIEEFGNEKLIKIGAVGDGRKANPKGILTVGKHGSASSQWGRRREDMERLFGTKVFAKLWVKVRESWREDEQTLAELGY